jgi:hypothetical protein
MAVLVEVKPIPAKKWHGKEGKESITRPKTITALPDETLNYKVALTPEQLEDYGKILKQDLSLQFILGDAHPFWDSRLAKVVLENNTQFFNVDNPIEAIKVAILKASKDVAPTLKDWEEGKYPEASHYIVDEREEIAAFLVADKKEKEARAKLEKLDKKEKGEIIFLMTGKIVKQQTEEFLNFELKKLFNSRLDDLITYLNQDKVETALRSLVNESVAKNIITKSGLKFLYFDQIIGNNLEEVVDYLRKEENQSFKLELMSKTDS